jgi:hypothetical protein
MHYEARTEKVFVRMRPAELERATRLAAVEEVHVPELFRRLLDKEWRRAAMQDDPQEAVRTLQQPPGSGGLIPAEANAVER